MADRSPRRPVRCRYAPWNKRTGILRQFAACFHDYRRANLVEHSVSELVRQRVYGIALGCEDLNDHDQLRQDPLLALLSGKRDVEGERRRREQDRGKAGAGKSTLNRLELTPADAKPEARYKKIVMDEAAVDGLLVDLYIQAQTRQPKRIVVDLDATDDPVHGEQEGRFFHGYYGCYCYLPLYIFIDEHLVCARLRSSNIDASAGALEEVQRIVKRLCKCESRAISMSFAPGGPPPASRTVRASVNGGALPFTAKASSTGNWLAVSPTSTTAATG